MWQTLQDTVRKRQERFDEEIRAAAGDYSAGGGTVHCGRGCLNCCSLAVHASFAEALRVADALNERHATALEKHVARLQEHLAGVSELRSYLRLHRQTIGACPFLEEDGACGVYAARPYACRALLSTRPAEWCGIDLATLDPWDRELYLSSLDPGTVAYPTHYLASPQEGARRLELEASEAMLAACGFALSGNLTALVHLEREWRLSATATRGAEAVAGLLAASGLDHPLLVSLDRQAAGPPTKPLYSNAESGRIPLRSVYPHPVR